MNVKVEEEIGRWEVGRRKGIIDLVNDRQEFMN